MLWKRKKKLEMLRMVKPTSKASLKQQCLLICRGDVKQAKELYDFYIEGMEDMPMFDSVPPTWMESAKDNLVGVFNWIKNNQNDIIKGYSMIHNIIKGNNIEIQEEGPEASLPLINE